MDLVLWLTAGYLALSAMVVAIATFVLYRALRGVTRLVFGPEPVFGSDARTRVIAFGVAALAFPSVVPWAVYLSVWVFIALFSDFPRW